MTSSCLQRQEVVRISLFLVRISLFLWMMSFLSTGRCSRLVGTVRAAAAGWSDCARLPQHWSKVEAASAAGAPGMLRAPMFIRQGERMLTHRCRSLQENQEDGGRDTVTLFPENTTLSTNVLFLERRHCVFMTITHSKVTSQSGRGKPTEGVAARVRGEGFLVC